LKTPEVKEQRSLVSDSTQTKDESSSSHETKVEPAEIPDGSAVLLQG